MARAAVEWALGRLAVAFGVDLLELPADKRLALVVYAAGLTVVAYLELVAVGDALPDTPLFLDLETFVPAPLEAT